jgi:hypothetical protein
LDVRSRFGLVCRGEEDGVQLAPPRVAIQPRTDPHHFGQVCGAELAQEERFVFLPPLVP